VLAPIGDKITRIGDPLGVGFLVTAGDPNGTVPSLATTPLPAGAAFGVATNGANAEGTFLWQPQAGQEGIHPIRFTASDGALSDSEQIRIYVGRSGEGTNQAGIPLSLENWAVDATNIVASSTAAWARVQWRSIPGIGYDLFCTDDALAPTGANWRPCASNIVPAGVNGEWTDSALGTGRMWRFYQIGLRGGGPVSNGIWGVVRRDAAADAYSLLGAPLRGDGRLDGELGRALSAVLSGDDGGPTDGVGDELYFLEADGAWRVVYLDRSRVWREADGKASALEVGAGRGWLLRRNAARAARATFSGPVGNDLTRQVTVRPGWNLLSISEGRLLRLADVFAVHAGGAPVGGITEAQADQIIAWDGAGQAHWLMYAQGWGAPYDGQWVDLATFEIPDVWLTPGQGLYYYRQPGGGNMTVDF
jgi:hypothetical protein